MKQLKKKKIFLNFISLIVSENLFIILKKKITLDSGFIYSNN
jgi:hypothetical protein